MGLDPKFKGWVETAIGGDTVESRALATQAIGRSLRDRDLSDAERDLSDRIFQILSRDVCEEVRRALAVTLRLSKNLPSDIANRLIHDVDSIAIPILSDSPVITDEDLISVLDSRAGTKAQAIASRQGLSRRVGDAVIRFGDKASIGALAANDTALISEEGARRLMEFASSDDLIRDAVLRRQDMPQDLALKLIDTHVDQIGDRLSPRTEQAEQLAEDMGERAKARWVGEDWSADTMLAYVDALHRRGGLTEAVLARAAGQGDWRFIQVALARLAAITPSKAGMMVLDPRPFALDALMGRCHLSEAVRALLTVSAEAFRDLERTGRSMSRQRFQRLMEERISTHPDIAAHEALWMDWIDAGLGPRAV